MLNIFYNPSYFKQDKVLLTKQFKYSIFYQYLIDSLYFLNMPFPERFVYSGPQKRMNNLIKTFKSDKEISFNKLTYNNSYIAQFDQFGMSVLEKINPMKNSEHKVIIGPLYNIEQDKKLNAITNKFENIKKLVASEMALTNAYELDKSFKSETAIVCPSGVISENQLLKNMKLKNRNQKCLIYFKNRSHSELEKLTKFLVSKNQEFKIFEYGKYNNQDLIGEAKKSKFGILLNNTETQGFAVQEILACNLPLIVWNSDKNYFDNHVLSGTSVTEWSQLCGEIFSDFSEFEDTYIKFMQRIEYYKPGQLVKEKLTYEVFSKKLKKSFDF